MPGCRLSRLRTSRPPTDTLTQTPSVQIQSPQPAITRASEVNTEALRWSVRRLQHRVRASLAFSWADGGDHISKRVASSALDLHTFCAQQWRADLFDECARRFTATMALPWLRLTTNGSPTNRSGRISIRSHSRSRPLRSPMNR